MTRHLSLLILALAACMADDAGRRDALVVAVVLAALVAGMWLDSLRNPRTAKRPTDVSDG